ncbi:MAG: hypothetical protein NTV58_12230 [Deltaproteobacteria bacterium]|nr:hypothetical protein [Deltaproteobacteria bacterium]
MGWLKNWKTTLAGCVTAGGYAALTAAQQGNIEPNQLAIIVGIAALGALAKDHNVTGGSVEQ